jgi:modification methylase
VCRGRERLTWQGVKAHPTQKPEALLERVILLSSHPGDLVLDPFFGTGTTGAVCQRFHRHWIGIEREPRYGELARQRIAHVTPLLPGLLPPDESPRDRPRVPFRALLDAGLLHPGDPLSFCCSAVMARVEADGTLTLHGQRGSLHQMGAAAAHQPTCNGWEHWYYQDEAGEWQPLNRLREEVRRRRTGGPVSGPPGEGHSGSRE